MVGAAMFVKTVTGKIKIFSCLVKESAHLYSVLQCICGTCSVTVGCKIRKKKKERKRNMMYTQLYSHHEKNNNSCSGKFEDVLY